MALRRESVFPKSFGVLKRKEKVLRSRGDTSAHELDSPAFFFFFLFFIHLSFPLALPS